jgi:hypothetical protein
LTPRPGAPPDTEAKKQSVLLYLLGVFVCVPLFGLSIAVALALGAGRGELLAAAPLVGPGVTRMRLRVPPGGVSWWADLEASWRGSRGAMPEVSYELEARQGARSLGSTTCKTGERGSSFCGIVSKVGAKFSGDCEVELRCELAGLPVGEEVEIVIRGSTGANVTEMRQMSLNARKRRAP